MLVAIPEVPETSHQQATAPTSSAVITTTTTSANHSLPLKHCGVLLNGGLESAAGGDAVPPSDAEGAGVGEALIKREMKPPISAAIPKSRNHRRTPPTPPALSPSPPALTPPPNMTSQTSVTPPMQTDLATGKIYIHISY